MEIDTLSPLVDVRNLLVTTNGQLSPSQKAFAVEALEVYIPKGHLTPRPPRHGQRKFARMAIRGALARRNGHPESDCPHRDVRGFESAYRNAWLRGWHQEDARCRQATAPFLFACRMLTMKRPHGRPSKV